VIGVVINLFLREVPLRKRASAPGATNQESVAEVSTAG